MTIQEILSNSLLQNEAIQKLFPFIGALLIILIGVFIASFIAKRAIKLFSNMKGFSFLRENIFQNREGREEKLLFFIVKFIYYIIVIFTIIAAAEKLGLTQVTLPLNNFLNSLFMYLPNVLGGIIFLLAAYILSKIGKYLTYQFLLKLKIDNKINGSNEDRFAYIFSDIVYVCIFIILIPGVLSAFQLDSVLSPISSMIEKFLVYLPNIVAAVIILGIGWFIAVKIKKVVKSLLDSARLEEKLKVSDKQIFDGKLSTLLSNIVYILILIPVVTAALDYLGLYNITSPIVNTIDIVLTFLPMIAGAIIILLVAGYFGKLLEGIVANLLIGFKFDAHLEKIGFKSNDNCFAKGLSKFAKFAVIYFAFVQAIEILHLEVLSKLSYSLTIVMANILLGLFILLIGVYLSTATSTFILNTNFKNKRLLSTIARVAILVFIGAMGLGQMGIAKEIINMAFGFTIGAIAIALAIAFGIGGRDIAAKKLEQFDNHLDKNKQD